MTDRGHGSSGSGDVICEDGEAREGSEGVEEVLVEVDREGAMDDEFRQEQQLEKTKKKLSRGKRKCKIQSTSFSLSLSLSLSLSISLSLYNTVVNYDPI